MSAHTPQKFQPIPILQDILVFVIYPTINPILKPGSGMNHQAGVPGPKIRLLIAMIMPPYPHDIPKISQNMV